jgi:hypothetical protein
MISAERRVSATLSTRRPDRKYLAAQFFQFSRRLLCTRFLDLFLSHKVDVPKALNQFSSLV